MTPTQTIPTMPDPTAVTGDIGCPDTLADTSGGQLGMLAHLLRVLLARFLPPWVYPPPSFRSYDVQGTIATPAIGASAVVFSLLVPTGFQTVIKRLSVNIIGPGFVQGSGSLIFSIRVNQAPVKGYGVILTELGSPQQPRPTDGILAASAQLVDVFVTNVSYAALGTNVTGSLSGWHYPTPQGRRPGR